MKFAWILVFSLGCGAAPAKTNAGGPDSSAETKPAASKGATLDCDALVNKIHTCADPFEAAFAKTQDAGNRGKQTAGGEPDGAAGAKTFMVAFRAPHNKDLVGMDMCKKSWTTRDPMWRDRLAACDATADCDTFSACAAPAIGDPVVR
ncbi:MAG: hypothetical protein AB8H79_17325 [Myxococcota bacterium]